MDLNFDRRVFQDLFEPRPKKTARIEELQSPAAAVLDRGLVLGALSESEDVGEWIGSPPTDLSSKLGDVELLTYDADEVDRWILNSIEELNSDAQLRHLKREALKGHRGVAKLLSTHFLLEAFRGWWRHILPRRMGALVRLRAGESWLIVFNDGFVEGCLRPESIDLLPDLRATILSLENHLGFNVIGIETNEMEWESWSESETPWKRLKKSVAEKKAQWVSTTRRGRWLPFICSHLGR